MSDISLKQKTLAKKVAEAINNGTNVTQAELIQSAGYNETSAKNPAIVFNTNGFKLALAELGFSLDAADTQVKNILVNGKKDENKLKAADLIYKRLGGYAPDRSIHVSVKGDIKEFEEFKELREEYEQRLLNTLTNEEPVRPVDNGMADLEPDKN